MIRSRMTIGAALLACLLALGACAAQVQVRQQDMAVTFSEGRFQLTWETAQTKKGSPLIAGYVQNTRGGGVANIRLQVDTLDAQGQDTRGCSNLLTDDRSSPAGATPFNSCFVDVEPAG